MKPKVFWIGGVLVGRLGIAARPRGGDWLADEVCGWRTAGVDSVVSLLTPSEEDELGLREEPAECLRKGLEFRSFPIPDRGVPPSKVLLKRLGADMLNSLNSGKSVLVHCRQGIGRSALLVAAILTLSGDNPDQAFQRIGEARGGPVPDTAEQRDWVKAFAQSLPERLRA
jgi:protein-tyrosine phosphatase